MKKYFLIVVLVLSLFLNLVLIWQANKADPVLTKSGQINSADLVNIDNCEFDSEMQIADWKTYTSEQGCFRIQYPDNWSYSQYNEVIGGDFISVVGFNDRVTDEFSKETNKIVINSYIHSYILQLLTLIFLKII